MNSQSARLESWAAALRGQRPTRDRTLRRDALHLVLGVTTFQRRDYLEGFIERFLATRNREQRWTLIVADDGSRDGSQDVVKSLPREPNLEVVLIQNRGIGVAGQTNTILRAAQQLDFDFGFKADDDLIMVEPGWDDLYLGASFASGFGHLVFHDRKYHLADHEVTGSRVVSRVSAMDSLGAFWTFTPDLVSRIGYFDEVEFPIRGHSHWDYTVRACRAGFNVASTLFDAEDSEGYLRLQPRETYVQTFDWKSDLARLAFSAEERERRLAVIGQPDRIHVAYEPLRAYESTAWTSRGNTSRLGVEFSPDRPGPSIPPGLVMSLARTPGRWRRVAGEIARAGMSFRRVLAVDGYVSPLVESWESYKAEGLVLPREQKLNRRLISSPGAMGYLHSARAAIHAAMRNRLESFVLFDDDVVAHVLASDLIGEAFHELPRQWRLLYLGSRQRDWSGVDRVSDHLYRTAVAPLGSFAVAIHHSAYRDLLDAIERFDSPFDDGPLSQTLGEHPDEVFVLWPPAFLPRVDDSLIREPRDLSALGRGAGWAPADYPGLEDDEVDPAADRWGVFVAIEPDVSLADLRRSLDGWRGQTHPNFDLNLIVTGELGASRIRALTDTLAADQRLRIFELRPGGSPMTALNVALQDEQYAISWLWASPTWPHPDALRNTLAEVATRRLDICLTPTATSGSGLPTDHWGRRLVELEPTSSHGGLVLSRTARERLGVLSEGSDLDCRLLRQRAAALDLRCSATAGAVGVDTGAEGALTLGLSPWPPSEASTARRPDIERGRAGRPRHTLVPVAIE